MIMVHTGGFSGIYTTPGTTDGHKIGGIKRLNKTSPKIGLNDALAVHIWQIEGLKISESEALTM